MKKWLVIEVLLFTFLPMALLIYATPLLLSGVLYIFNPLEGGPRILMERVLSVLPYIGGGLAIGVLWYCAFFSQRNSTLVERVIICMGFLGGVTASWELMTTTNMTSFIVICLPPWLLAIHLGYLNYKKIR